MPRPRLHRSSIVVGTLVAILLILIEVPGRVISGVFGTNVSQVFEHGWPWVYLRRETSRPNPTIVTAPDGTQVEFQYSLVVTPINPRYDLPYWGIPWLNSENWRFWETDRTAVPLRWIFNRAKLFCNVAVSLALVTGVIAAWEVWRRRRQRLLPFRFGLVEMFIAVACVSTTLGWLVYVQREFQRENRIIERQLNRDLPADFEDYWVEADEVCVAPAWIRSLFGERFFPAFFWRTCAVDIQSDRGDRTDLICAEISRLDYVTKIAINGHPRRRFRFSALRNLERIKTLEIWRPTILDEQVLNELSQLKQLTKLVIEDIEDVPFDALARLKAELPNCRIIHYSDDW
jgi:hypothetical protein